MEYEKFDRKEFIRAIQLRRKAFELDVKTTLMVLLLLNFAVMLLVITHPLIVVELFLILCLAFLWLGIRLSYYSFIPEKFQHCPCCGESFVGNGLNSSFLCYEWIVGSARCPYCGRQIITDGNKQEKCLAPDDIKGGFNMVTPEFRVLAFLPIVVPFALYGLLLIFNYSENNNSIILVVAGGVVSAVLTGAGYWPYKHYFRYRKNFGPTCPNCGIGLHSCNLRAIARLTGGCGNCGAQIIQNFTPPPVRSDEELFDQWKKRNCASPEVQKFLNWLWGIYTLVLIGILLVYGVIGLITNPNAGSLLMALIGLFIVYPAYRMIKKGIQKAKEPPPENLEEVYQRKRQNIKEGLVWQIDPIPPHAWVMILALLMIASAFLGWILWRMGTQMMNDELFRGEAMALMASGSLMMAFPFLLIFNKLYVHIREKIIRKYAENLTDEI